MSGSVTAFFDGKAVRVDAETRVPTEATEVFLSSRPQNPTSPDKRETTN